MMSFCVAFYFALILLFCKKTLSQPAYEYYGTGIVNITGQYNWTLKYPLGGICEDPNWIKTLTIDVTCLTSEGDLVMAFGTSSTYFAIAMAYDGILWVPLNNGETKRSGALFVTPPAGSVLREATTTLEEQYATSTDFRESLIENGVQTTNWESLVPEDTTMADNGQQLVLKIIGDRVNDVTQLTVSKNNVTATITMGSTWNTRDDVFFFMGCDPIKQTEIFTLSGIQSKDECTWNPAPTPPTTAAPTENTIMPSMAPSKSPTIDPSLSPSQSPTDITSDPSISPSEIPSILPSEIPSISPSEIPSISPTNIPSISPSDIPGISPITSSTVAVTTREPTSMPVRISISPPPTRSPTVAEDDDQGENNDENEDELDAQGDGKGLTVLHWIIIGGVLLGLVIIIILGWYCGKKYRKKRKNRKRMNELFGSTDDVQHGIEMNNSPTTPNSVNQLMGSSNEIQVDDGIIATNDIPESPALPDEVDEVETAVTNATFLDKCGQCGLEKQGNIDADGDGLFYCLDCWKQYN